MVRSLIKAGVACGVRGSGLPLLWRALDGRSGTPWIVSYHRVVEDFARSALTSIAPMLISVRMLERHLDWIAARYDCVSLDDLGERLARGRRLRRPAAAITFDDGYSDAYHHAFPILKAKGIPAAVFVLTAFVGTTRIPLHDRLHLLLCRATRTWPRPADALRRLLGHLALEAPASCPAGPEGADPLVILRALLESLPPPDLERLCDSLEAEVGIEPREIAERRPLSWEMLEEMRRAGITIASHSRTHPLLTRQSGDAARGEIAGSRRDLETRLGFEVRHFAYPNGWFDPPTVRAVADAGYRWAYTSCRHRDSDLPLLTLPRTLLWERSSLGTLGTFSPAVMDCHAGGVFDRLSGCRLDHSRWRTPR